MNVELREFVVEKFRGIPFEIVEIHDEKLGKIYVVDLGEAK